LSFTYGSNASKTAELRNLSKNKPDCVGAVQRTARLPVRCTCQLALIGSIFFTKIYGALHLPLALSVLMRLTCFT
jgi:hypothetical protein